MVKLIIFGAFVVGIINFIASCVDGKDSSIRETPTMGHHYQRDAVFWNIFHH